MAKIDRTKINSYGSLDLLAKQVVEGFITGLHKSPFHGFSVEFAEHRLYNTGESTRHLDWKLFAKTDKLFVKRYEEETNLRCRIVIDTSSSMLFPTEKNGDALNKLNFSIYSAAALIELMRRQRDAFGITTFNEGIDYHSDAKSNAGHQRLVYHQLESLMETSAELKSTSAVDSLHHISEMIHKRSMVIIFSDMFDNSDRETELVSALQHLKHNKHEVILFHVVDRAKELDFDYENRPYRFVDMESGAEVKLNPIDVKEEYLKQVTSREKELILKCGQFGIEYVAADINKDFNQILLPFLIRRKKMS